MGIGIGIGRLQTGQRDSIGFSEIKNDGGVGGLVVDLITMK